MKPTSCKELKLFEGVDTMTLQEIVEMKPTSCKELKQHFHSVLFCSFSGRNETYFLQGIETKRDRQVAEWAVSEVEMKPTSCKELKHGQTVHLFDLFKVK